VPDIVKRTSSAEGMSCATHSAQRTSSSWQAPRWVPRAACAWIALTTLG